MYAFKYRGVDVTGERVEGEVLAGSIDEAERRLSSREITILSIVPGGQRARGEGAQDPADLGGEGSKRAYKVKDAEVAAILRDLAVMAETGVPFVEALDAVASSAQSNNARNGLRQLRSEVVGGKGLSAGMRSSGGLFPPVVCELVRVAEEGGRLDRALSSAAMYVERAADLRRKVVNAMLYPAVLTVIAVAALAVLICFVLPKFSGIFKSMGADVPATTLAILSVGDYVRQHPWWVLAGVVVAIVALRAAWALPKFQELFGSFVLKVPVVGELARKLALSRAFQSIATLLSCNVSLMSALEHGAKVSGNSAVQRSLMEVRDGVERGGALSECLATSDMFPQMLVQVVGVGERTGRLAALLASSSNHMEDEVDARIKALVSIVEPVMITVMGCVVGFITISIISPIYSVVQNIK